jgi:hypothetical protein
MCYSALLSSDIASVLIPMSTFSPSLVSPFIDLQPDMRYHTSSIFASALEVSTGFQRISSSSMAHADSRSFDLNTPESRVAADSTSDGNWVAEVTKNYQHRLCGLEACLPFPINPSTDESFAPLWDVLSHSQSGQTVLNPFMASLSSATWGSYAAKEVVLRTNRAHPPETNIINCRGFQSSRMCAPPPFLLFPYLTCPQCFRLDSSRSFTTRPSIPIALLVCTRGAMVFPSRSPFRQSFVAWIAKAFSRFPNQLHPRRSPLCSFLHLLNLNAAMSRRERRRGREEPLASAAIHLLA